MRSDWVPLLQDGCPNLRFGFEMPESSLQFQFEPAGVGIVSP
jgi:hypothetical protein